MPEKALPLKMLYKHPEPVTVASPEALLSNELPLMAHPLHEPVRVSPHVPQLRMLHPFMFTQVQLAKLTPAYFEAPIQHEEIVPHAGLLITTSDMLPSQSFHSYPKSVLLQAV